MAFLRPTNSPIFPILFPYFKNISAILEANLANGFRYPEDSPHRHPSTPRILGSLVSGMQHLSKTTETGLCQQELGHRTPARPAAAVHSSQHQPRATLDVNLADCPMVLRGLSKPQAPWHTQDLRITDLWTQVRVPFCILGLSETTPNRRVHGPQKQHSFLDRVAFRTSSSARRQS